MPVIRSWSFEYPFAPASVVECPFCGSRKTARSLRQVNSTIKDGCDDCSQEEPVTLTDLLVSHMHAVDQELFLKAQQRETAD